MDNRDATSEGKPRVLVGVVTWEGHSHLLDEFYESVMNLSYPSFDLFVVDTSKSTEYYELLKKKLEKYSGFGHKIDVYKGESIINFPSIHIVLAYAREYIRQKTIIDGYDYCFMLDSDMFVPNHSIETLMNHDKDWVGFPYQYKFNKPSMFKSGWLNYESGYTLDLYSNDELKAMKPGLVKVYAAGMGCSLFKRSVFEKVPFRTMVKFVCGEDIWFNNEAAEKGVECYVDTSIEPVHKTKQWDDEERLGGTKVWAAIQLEADPITEEVRTENGRTES